MKVKTQITAGQGLGDTVADLAHMVGGDCMARTYEQITGKPCGCKERQEFLNSLSLPGFS